MFKQYYDHMNGKFLGVTTIDCRRAILKNGHGWDEFLKWQDSQPPEQKLDLSDQPHVPQDESLSLESRVAALEQQLSTILNNINWNNK